MSSPGQIRTSPLLRYAALALIWGVGIFGLLRLPWVELHLLLPFTIWQERAACVILGEPETPIRVGLSCSASDVIALCLGAVLAFPVAWRRRLAGAALGMLLIVTLNIARLGSLGRVAGQRDLFELLHLYVWPAALILATTGFVFLWMRRVTREPASTAPISLRVRGGVAVGRFALLALLLVGLYVGASAWYLQAAWLEAAAAWAAIAAAAIASALGVAAEASEGLLRTPHGAFRVTPECVATPLLPVYLAGALSLPLSAPRRAVAVLAAPPLFFALATVRLLVLALPQAAIGSHFVAVHGFNQLLVGILVVAAVALRPSPVGATGRGARAVVAVAGGLAVGLFAGPLYTRTIFRTAELAVAALGLEARLPPDPQGALLVLPGFQLALFSGLWLAVGAPRRRSWSAALAALAAIQVLLLAAVALAGDARIHPREIRALAVALPLVAAWLAARAASAGGHTYRGFWDRVGREFPDLAGARSTLHYRREEEWLLDELLGPLQGLRLLKTDLWDEAKNTRILRWAAGAGARAHGLDISLPIVQEARRGFARRSLPLSAVVADIRHAPFADRTFDAVYSMGTVEHFRDTDLAVREIGRLLRPGGRAVIGVPNRRDPFLRPVLVALLYRLGLYGYGFEKSFSRPGLRRIIEAAGLRVVAEEGILFVPGWLRMLDLACHTWARPLSRLTGTAVAAFELLSRRWPRLRRHGYLLATLALRPEDRAPRQGGASRSTADDPGA